MPIRRGGRELSAREQAAELRKLTGWSRQEYQRRYDVLRNRVRTYERATGATEPINVADLMFRNERRRIMSARYGEPYQPTALYQAIMQAPASGSSRPISTRTQTRIEDAELQRALRQFGGVIYNSKYSEELLNIMQTGLQMERDELGTFDRVEFARIAEQRARDLQEERETAQRLNQNLRDPRNYTFFHS